MKFIEIDKRMKALAGAPVQVIPDSVMDGVVAELERKTPKSKMKYKAAEKVIPGGMEHMLSHTNPYPVIIEKGDGAYLEDVDGNRYVDYMCGGGPVILGHNNPAVLKGIQEALKEKGWFHGLPDEYETLAAELIVKHMPAVERVRFFQSGTEACMAAVRAARAFTGRKKIIKFRGCYHGWSDQFVIDMWVPYTERLLANGIPEEMSANTVLVPLNDAAALEAAIKENKDDGGVACVILEPMGPESGTIPMDEKFPKEIRRVCRDNDVLIVFDEVVTGFRVSLGGAQEYYGINPDLTVLGKLISSGFPSTGAVGGRIDIMDTLRSGIAMDGGPSAFVAGTMAANPLTCAAVYHSINEIERTGAVREAAVNADILVSKLNEMFESRGSMWFAYNYASILHIEMTGMSYIDIREKNGLHEIFERKGAMAQCQTFLRNEGIMTLMGKGYVTMVHTEEDIDKTVAAFEKLLDAVQ